MDATEATQAYRRVMLRVVAPLAGLIVLSSIDRVNISFAALAMRHDIGLDPAAYGLGAGLFFVGYLLFQLPSVALLQRIGARRWIALGVCGWGITATALATITAPWQFHVLRVVLGAFESGFAPGVVWYVSRWLPPAYRGRSLALTLVAIPTSVIIGGPLCGWLLSLHAGMAGWRLMFAVEGALTVVAGLLALTWFVDSPHEATWLSKAEWIALSDSNLEVSDTARPSREPADRATLWRCALLWLVLVTASNGLIFWLPSAIAAAGPRDPLAIGLLTALPWAAIAAGMVLNARHSDRAGERRRHLAVAMLLAAAGLAASGVVGTPVAALMALTVGGLGLGGAQSVFWTIPTEAFSATRARAVAIINLIGNAGSAAAPAAIGLAVKRTGSLLLPELILAALLALATVLVATLRTRGVAAQSIVDKEGLRL